MMVWSIGIGVLGLEHLRFSALHLINVREKAERLRK